MKLRVLLVLIWIFGASSPVFSGNPKFKTCDCAETDSCTNERLALLKQEIKQIITEERGYYFNDSIYIQFSVSEKGKLKITDEFHLFSDYVAARTTNILNSLDGEFCDGEGFYLSITFDLPPEIKEFPELERVDHPIPVKGAEKFNIAGRRGASRYLVYQMTKAIRKERTPRGDHSGRIYLSQGQVVAVEYTSFEAETYFSDLIAPYFYKANDELVPSDELGNTDDQWIEFNLGPVRDSNARYKYQVKQLEYLIELKNKQAFLSSMLEIATKYYEEKEKAEFILENIKKAGLPDAEVLTIDGKKLNIDSLASFEPGAALSEDEIISSHMVESLPSTSECQGLDNEELRICLQRSILTFVSRNFKYPDEARKKGIQGRVYVNFVIEKNGKVGMVKILRGAHPLLDLESIRVASELPEVTPAMQRGKPVRMEFTLPINAKLQ